MMIRTVEFIRLPAFEKARRKVLDDVQIKDVEEKLALRPDLGEMVQKTGGARKIHQMGLSGDARVIYYFHPGKGRVYFLTCYSKNKQKDLTEEEKTDLKELTKAIKDALKGE